MATSLEVLASEIRACTRCDRLAAFLRESREARPDYWSRPVSGFGDPAASLCIVGLAPGFHGANRHGRVFTGDDSGRWLWGALHELGVCSHVNCTSGDQPLALTGVYVNNVVRCVPPRNRPTADELSSCRKFLGRELALLSNVRVVLALGKLAHDSYLKHRGMKLSSMPFRHGAAHRFEEAPEILVDSYHPSRQNTNTGVLTWDMWLGAVRAAIELASSGDDADFKSVGG